jgi:hypothetical protein
MDMVTARLKKLKGVDDEMTEYFHERAQAEEAYAKHLSRIAKKWPSPAADTNMSDSQRLWAMVAATANEAANCHQLLASRLVNELEKSVRQSPVEPQWTQQRALDVSMSKLARDVDDKMGKTLKYKRQLDMDKKPAEAKTKKLDDIKVQLDIALTQWKTESPAAFESFESVDRAQGDFIKSMMQKAVEAHINNLRIQLLVLLNS